MRTHIAAATRCLRLPRACQRRRRALAPLAQNILRSRGDGRPLTPTAWAALALLFWLLSQTGQLGLFLVPSLALFSGLALIALFDARYFVVPDGPVLFLAACGLATSIASAPDETPARIAAGLAGYTAFKLVAATFERLRGVQGLGDGDAHLFAVAGLWLGARGLPSALVFAVLSALLSAAIAIRQGALEHARQPIPFAPHLALGIWLVWAAGPLEIG
ncbi:MAG: prepilin peptidase [Methylocystis sp.]|nr:MAG: prepilin peptidase [Methylocystis sp.]